MATLELNKNKVAIIPRQTALTNFEKRGPKPKVLPLELIIQWSGEGAGSKKIASRLKIKYGIEVSFRTIARIISGQRCLGST